MRCLLAVFLLLGTIDVHAQTQDVAAGAQLKALLDEDLDASRRPNPIEPTVRGIPGHGHLLPDPSSAASSGHRRHE